jgi:hypothetical protein
MRLVLGLRLEDSAESANDRLYKHFDFLRLASVPASRKAEDFMHIRRHGAYDLAQSALVCEDHTHIERYQCIHGRSRQRAGLLT